MSAASGDEVEAAEAYDTAAAKRYGDYARRTCDLGSDAALFSCSVKIQIQYDLDYRSTTRTKR